MARLRGGRRGTQPALQACPDAGLAGLWRISFDEIARHARIVNSYARKGSQLRWWLRHQRGRDEDADE